MKETGVDRILSSLISQLYFHKPSNVVEFMVTYLQHYQEKESAISDQRASIRPVNQEETAGGATEMEQDNDDRISSSEPSPRGNDEIDFDMAHNRSLQRRRGAISSEPVDITNLDEEVPTPKVPKSQETQQALEAALRTNVLFAHLEEDERRQVFDAMIEVNYKAGDVIIRQGILKIHSNICIV